MKQLRKIIILIITLISFILSISFAYSSNIETIFKDIDTNYKYYKELQALYNKGMIFPDENWNFNPDALLTRAEFIWILTELTCQDCISPNVPLNIYETYKDTQTFFDVPNTNKYYYCIADSKNKWYISWYQAETICQDGTVNNNMEPFCPNNTIILEEALAIILRASWILTNSQAENYRYRILSWEVTSNLSIDVSPLNSDGSVYSFYPDFARALEYELLEYDNNWNETKYNLVKLEDNKLNPKKEITKEDFLYIAYVTMRANSCIKRDSSDMWLKINIYEKTCNENVSRQCKNIVPYSNEKVYDLNAIVDIESWDSISNDSQYIWRIYNKSTQEERNAYWKYLNNYDFRDFWSYKISLQTFSDEWKYAEAYSDIIIKDSNNTSISVNIEYSKWASPYTILFTWNSDSGPNLSYIWDFWDGNTWYWKTPVHIYKEEGYYNVVLIVIDENWNRWESKVVVYIYDSNNNNNNNNNNGEDIYLDNYDYDWDWVIDREDRCPTIYWVKENYWCPLVACSGNDCNIRVNCDYSGGDLVIWNVVCNTCPCEYSIDFNSSLRKCDIVFPTITSPDATEIFGKWNYYRYD